MLTAIVGLPKSLSKAAFTPTDFQTKGLTWVNFDIVHPFVQKSLTRSDNLVKLTHAMDPALAATQSLPNEVPLNE